MQRSCPAESEQREFPGIKAALQTDETYRGSHRIVDHAQYGRRCLVGVDPQWLGDMRIKCCANRIDVYTTVHRQQLFRG